VILEQFPNNSGRTASPVFSPTRKFVPAIQSYANYELLQPSEHSLKQKRGNKIPKIFQSQRKKPLKSFQA
jgi:ABC-type microcin C transport system duplicated ATPase subunit YejF